MSSSVDGFQFSVHSRKRKRGFSLIELMVVISIGVLISFVSIASYLSYDKSLKLKNAAEDLKSDLRYTQNKALAGDKSTSSSSNCGSTLLGWFMTINQNATQYTINNDCVSGGSQIVNVIKTVQLKNGIKIESTSFSSNVNVFFQTLDSIIYFKNASDSPPYFAQSGNSYQIISPLDLNADLTITLVNDSGDRYQVLVRPTGEMNANK